jgi:RNA polymerase sigma-70 factor, ECF subfamily
MTMVPAQIELFEKYKRTLFVVAYKMTKSVADAEDIVHDVFISFSNQAPADIHNLENYLVKSVMNRSLSLLEKQKHITYPGVNLPEPLFHERSHHIHEQDISYALLLLLQTLNPAERAIFILRETLAFKYAEIAEILSIREEDCRQQLHRAKEKIANGKIRYAASPAKNESFFTAFLKACMDGDAQQLMTFLKEDIIIYSDGGGKVTAARQPIVGRHHAISFLTGIYNKFASKLLPKITPINGELGVLLFDTETGHVDTVMVFIHADDRDALASLCLIRNPDKIAGEFYSGSARIRVA